MKRRLLAWSFSAAALAVFVVSGCASIAPAGAASSSAVPAGAKTGLASGLYWQPCATPGVRWAALLPGASGLKIFDDDQHYFRAAEALNARGFDVLLVDYKRAYRAAPDRPDVPTGHKITWVVERAVAWAREAGKIRTREPGAILAWSLGAEGLWPLLPDQGKMRALGLSAAAAYYPANEDGVRVATTLPLLILQGEADDVTPLADLRKALPTTASPLIEVKTYAGAHHGFDIASLREPKTIRLLPLIGPSGTFGYDAKAAGEAWEALAMFLDAHVRP